MSIGPQRKEPKTFLVLAISLFQEECGSTLLVTLRAFVTRHGCACASGSSFRFLDSRNFWALDSEDTALPLESIEHQGVFKGRRLVGSSQCGGFSLVLVILHLLPLQVSCHIDQFFFL